MTTKLENIIINGYMRSQTAQKPTHKGSKQINQSPQQSQQNLKQSIRQKKAKLVDTFYKMLQQNESKEGKMRPSSKKADLAKRSTSMKDGKIKSNDLLFAFNFENKHKCIKKVAKYSQYKKIPSAKGKRKPDLVYPETIESSNMISMVLTKSATMKYQKVREYLQQKSLEELKHIHKVGTKNAMKSKKSDLVVQDENSNHLNQIDSSFILNKDNRTPSLENLKNQDIYFPK